MRRPSTSRAAARFRSTFFLFGRREISNEPSSARTSVPSSATSRGNDMINDVIKDVQHRMHGAIDALHREFKSLRTGRANAAMLDMVTVDYYGTPTPIAQVASIKVPEASMIVAEPWDKSMVGAIEKAIRNADLGLN